MHLTKVLLVECRNISFITTVLHDFKCSVVLCVCLTASVDN